MPLRCHQYAACVQVSGLPSTSKLVPGRTGVRHYKHTRVTRMPPWKTYKLQSHGLEARATWPRHLSHARPEMYELQIPASWE